MQEGESKWRRGTRKGAYLAEMREGVEQGTTLAIAVVGDRACRAKHFDRLPVMEGLSGRGRTHDS
jgi:hypothetical protein